MNRRSIDSIMKKGNTTILFALLITLLFSCTASKNATNLKPTRNHLAGNWIISNIAVEMPQGYKVTNVFDEAPYSDFKESNWDLIRNGNGSFTLSNGTKENIYWSVNGSGDNAQFQFKKLNGAKPRNVETGYKLKLGPISDSSFTATSVIDAGNNQTGTITYTFSKK